MKVEVAQYLPHEPPMVMIKDGEEIGEGEATASAVTTRENVFFDPSLDGVPGCAAIEYMAQTMALAVGLSMDKRGEAPKVGFILGSRKLTITVPVFRREGEYRIHVKCDYVDEEFGSFVCEITDETGAVVAEGTMTAYQTNKTTNQKQEQGVK